VRDTTARLDEVLAAGASIRSHQERGTLADGLIGDVSLPARWNRYSVVPGVVAIGMS